MRIEVVYALPETQRVISLSCAPGTTISEAINRSGILSEFPELLGRNHEVGVHGRKQDFGFRLSDRDRVEIYRPLEVTPTEARRLRAMARNVR